MSDDSQSQSEFILYQTEDGRTRIQCRFENEMQWLTQKLMAELFQIGVNMLNHCLKEIFAEGELQAEATIRRYRIVQTDGSRQISRDVEHYNLAAILSLFGELGDAAATVRSFLIVQNEKGMKP